MVCSASLSENSVFQKVEVPLLKSCLYMMIVQEGWISQSSWAVFSVEKAGEQRKPGHAHPNPWATQLFINPSCLWPPGFMIHHNTGILGSIPFPRNVYKGQGKADFQGLCDVELLENNCINCKIKLGDSSQTPVCSDAWWKLSQSSHTLEMVFVVVLHHDFVLTYFSIFNSRA